MSNCSCYLLLFQQEILQYSVLHVSLIWFHLFIWFEGIFLIFFFSIWLSPTGVTDGSSMNSCFRFFGFVHCNRRMVMRVFPNCHLPIMLWFLLILAWDTWWLEVKCCLVLPYPRSSERPAASIKLDDCLWSLIENILLPTFNHFFQIKKTLLGSINF